MSHLESKIQADILNWLRKISYVKKIITSNEAGTLDIIGCYKGRFYSIEVKAEGEKPTALQRVNIAEIKKNGGIAFWATSLQEVQSYFDANMFVNNSL